MDTYEPWLRQEIRHKRNMEYMHEKYQRTLEIFLLSGIVWGIVIGGIIGIFG